MYKTMVLFIEEDDKNVYDMLSHDMDEQGTLISKADNWATLLFTMPVYLPSGKTLNGNLYIAEVEDEHQALMLVFDAMYLAITMYDVDSSEYVDIVRSMMEIFIEK